MQYYMVCLPYMLIGYNAWLLTNTPRYSHITPVMLNLHWLPVTFMIILKANLMTFKAIHGLAPVYLSNITSFKGNSTYNLRSNFSNLLARPAIRSAKTTGDRVFLELSSRKP